MTAWIRELGSDRQEPATALWSRFERQMVAYIARIVHRGPHLGVCDDALANAVFQSVVQMARNGELGKTHRKEFWSLIKTIAARQVIDHRRTNERQKRGGGKVVTESVVRAPNGLAHEFLDHFPTNDLAPDVAAMTAEILCRVAERLDEEQRNILELRLEGHTVSEIALQVNKSTPTVERKLRLIRKTLEACFESHDVDDTTR